MATLIVIEESDKKVSRALLICDLYGRFKWLIQASNQNLAQFSFHWRCKEVNLTHLYLCFALVIGLCSLMVLPNQLQQFTAFLKDLLAFLACLPMYQKVKLTSVESLGRISLGILSMLGFTEGSLPVKYLGVPL